MTNWLSFLNYEAPEEMRRLLNTGILTDWPLAQDIHQSGVWPFSPDCQTAVTKVLQLTKDQAYTEPRTLLIAANIELTKEFVSR